MEVIKVLIVDDSALVRQTFKSLLESDPDIRVIGTASDPYIAVQKIQKERPDVITLDIEMPKMDGLTFLTKIMKQAPMPVVVISNQTLKGAEAALKALESGAVDVMTKPNLSSQQLWEESRISLIDKVKSAFYARSERSRQEDASLTPGTNHNKDTSSGGPIKNFAHGSNTVIAVGASTGGTEAIKNFLQVLPERMPPILIVQHMPEKFTASFAKRLNESCALTVKEAENNEEILNGTVYIAPGGRHMSVIRSGSRKVLRISDGELVNRHRPSVNVLFNSVAETIGKHGIGIILTGMGDDGATGLLAMRQRGAFTIAQDEASSVVYGMPYKAVLHGAAEKVLPLSRIAQHVCDYLQSEAVPH